MQVNIDKLKEEISNNLIYNPLHEAKLSFLKIKLGRLKYFLRLIEAEKILQEVFTDRNISELKNQLEYTQKKINDHLSQVTSLEPEEKSYKELIQTGSKHKQLVNAFIRKNKRSRIGRSRIRHIFS
jgi:uncharacterized membrane-anchored protein YhcB (DUF1043 family)